MRIAYCCSFIINFSDALTDSFANFLSLLCCSCFSCSDCPDWLISDHCSFCLISCYILESNFYLLANEIHCYALFSLLQSLSTAHDRCNTVLKCFQDFFVDIFVCLTEVISSLRMSKYNVFYSCIYEHSRRDLSCVSSALFEVHVLHLEHESFDVIASNIPFGNFRVFDAEMWKKGGMYEQSAKTIHNYFFVKAMELLNEGGLLAFVAPRGIADTPGNKFVREYLVNHADLITALRLPDTLFMQTSGIEVGSDLLIFQSTAARRRSSLREKMFLQVSKEKVDTAGTMTDYANKIFTLPKTRPCHGQSHCAEPVR